MALKGRRRELNAEKKLFEQKVKRSKRRKKQLQDSDLDSRVPAAACLTPARITSLWFDVLVPRLHPNHLQPLKTLSIQLILYHPFALVQE